MSWFSNIFQRKRGGTMGGRMIRAAISLATSGMSDVFGITNHGKDINSNLPE